MKKRVAGMALISVLLCGLVATQAPRSAPRQNEPGFGQEATVAAVLRPDTEGVAFEREKPVGIPRAIGRKDTLTPASDYGQIFPYAAAVAGWKQDGTPVYRYALADSVGELVTNAVYTSVERKSCQNKLIWLLYSRAEDGGTRVSCAARDGSWVLGPFDGSIVVSKSCILVQRVDSAATTVYDSNGKIVGQVNGTVTSCEDGIIVSREEAKNIWYISSADSAEELAVLTAVRVGAFSDGSATVQLSETEWGFVNEAGTVVTTDAAWIDESCDGYALARDADGKFGVLASSGRKAIDFAYTNGVRCGDGHPLYQLWENEANCIVVSALNRQKLMLPDDLGGQRLTALPDNYFAYTNVNGNTVIFDDLKRVELDGKAVFYPQKDDLVAVTEAGYQLFDVEEGDIGKLHPYRYVLPEQETARQDAVFAISDPDTGLQGIGNMRGRVVLAPVYDSIASVDGSYFAAVRGGWSGIVDAHGDWIVRTRLAGIQ